MITLLVTSDYSGHSLYLIDSDNQGDFLAMNAPTVDAAFDHAINYMTFDADSIDVVFFVSFDNVVDSHNWALVSDIDIQWLVS